MELAPAVPSRGRRRRRVPVVVVVVADVTEALVVPQRGRGRVVAAAAMVLVVLVYQPFSPRRRRRSRRVRCWSLGVPVKARVIMTMMMIHSNFQENRDITRRRRRQTLHTFSPTPYIAVAALFPALCVSCQRDSSSSLLSGGFPFPFIASLRLKHRSSFRAAAAASSARLPTERRRRVQECLPSVGL